tara:strand:- start:216 stop:596 length:381 start_codon:yes stop_codon:yes gene_type:complete
LGTAFLSIGVNWSSGEHQPFAIGIVIFLAIVFFGFPCGAHYNPAVTISVFMKEGKMSNLPFCISIIISQILGAAFGCLLVYLSVLEHDLIDGDYQTNRITILCPGNGQMQQLDNSNTHCSISGRSG